jgi:hypothetical protein
MQRAAHFAPLHFATHLYAKAEFVEGETARGTNQPNGGLSTSSAQMLKS